MRRRVDEGGVAVVVGVLHQLYLVVKVVMLAAVCVDWSLELSTPRGIGHDFSSNHSNWLWHRFAGYCLTQFLTSRIIGPICTMQWYDWLAWPIELTNILLNTLVTLVKSSCYWVKPTRHTSWYDKITDLNYVAVKRLQVVPVNLSCQPPWQWWSLLGPCCGWKLCWLTLVTHTCVTWWVLPTAMFEPPPKWDWCSHCTAVRVSPISILNKLRIAWSWVLNSYPE